MKNKVRLTIALALAFCTMEIKAQGTVGSTAPDWTFTDINNVSHNLYNILATGKTVVIDAFATWCPHCWNYHNTSEATNFYNQYGPPGTNQAEVLYIELTSFTGIDCLQGNTSSCPGTKGDWITGTPYPIINHPNKDTLDDFKIKYQITGIPTTILICPDKKIGLKGSWTTAFQLKSAMDQCGSTSVADVKINPDVSVFPNPSDGHVFVTINEEREKGINIKVYNVIGEVISEIDEKISAPKKFKLDLSKRPNGIYLVEVKTESGDFFEKVVLNK